MNSKIISTTVDILGKPYPIRCPEEELPGLQQAAALLNEKMNAVKASGTVINPERIAIISALNLAHQLLQANQQKTSFLDRINDKLQSLQTKIDHVMNPTETEWLYKSE